MNQEAIRKYARFAVRMGSAVQPGETLIINAPIHTAAFARLCAEEAYAAGAREVVVHYSDEQISRLRMAHAAEEALDEAKPWIQDSYTSYMKHPSGACMLSISSADPEIYKGIDASRIDRASRARAMAMTEYYKYVMSNQAKWTIVAIPSPSWSAKVFPDLPVEEAEEKLWEAIFSVCRIDENDPVENWQAPLHTMHSRAEWLNSLQLDALHITSANGTDLTIGLPKNHIWAGGSEFSPKGVEFLANIPTEEVFTAPDARRTEGIVYSTKPYVFNGSLIENFWVRFENGRVVEYHAEKREDLLGMLVSMDEGAARLGEIALVPATSPINRSGILFYNTLFDENASCHIAFGKAYPICVQGGNDMTNAEKEAAGINLSNTHQDVMVGAEDTNIDGITADGQIIPVFRNGVWAE